METPADTENQLSLRYEGGLADNGTLLLPEYTASLDGWRDLFQFLGELYFHASPELRKVRGTDLLRVVIVAERRGSYETLLYFVLGAAAGGIIGNRADAAAVWSFRKLVEWYKAAVTTFVRKKSETTDYTAIVAALDRMAAERSIPLEAAPPNTEQNPLFDPTTTDAETDDADSTLSVHADRASALAERLDQALKRATQPLENSCQRLRVSISKTEVLLDFGSAERAVIAAPLSVPPPKREWRSAKVRFERINRKTGRALFFFENEPEANAAHYCRIIDLDVVKPHNRYTQAFNDDAMLDVWVRQTHPERGRLNLQWEVTAKDPGEGMLFNMPPPD